MVVLNDDSGALCEADCKVEFDLLGTVFFWKMNQQKQRPMMAAVGVE